VRDDVRIIEASLGFVNDLLRSMLDLHRARSKQLTLEYLLTDVKCDILDPVASMLYRRDDLFDVFVECPQNLAVRVDRLRLKQIVLNLARNSAKFVKQGVVRIRAKSIGDGQLYIYVEDSGPGIPEEKKTTPCLLNFKNSWINSVKEPLRKMESSFLLLIEENARQLTKRKYYNSLVDFGCVVIVIVIRLSTSICTQNYYIDPQQKIMAIFSI
jgi:light-regulated signal transduction histidine kinase (bacteriophytochrome)